MKSTYDDLTVTRTAEIQAGVEKQFDKMQYSLLDLASLSAWCSANGFSNASDKARDIQFNMQSGIKELRAWFNSMIQEEIIIKNTVINKFKEVL